MQEVQVTPPAAEPTPRGKPTVKARLVTAIRRVPTPLAILLAAATVMSVAWATVVPPLQSPDEIAHFSYAQRIAEGKGLPQHIRNGPSYSTEIGVADQYLNLAMLVGNLQGRPETNPVMVRKWEQVVKALPSSIRSDGVGGNPARQNPPLYYLYETVPYLITYHASILDRLLLMRLFDLPLYLSTIVFAWLIAGELLGPRQWPKAVAAGVVAVHAQLAFIGSSINPDIALAAIWSMFFWVAIRTVKYGPTLRRVLAIGLLFAASFLSHARGFPLVLPAAAALALGYWRHRPVSLRGASWFGAAAVIGGAAVIGYQSYVSGTGTTVNLSSISSNAAGGKPASIREFLSYVWQFYLPKLPFQDPMIGPHYTYKRAFVDTFYGIFGNLEVEFPPWVHSWELWFSLALVAGVVLTVIVRWRSVLRQWDVALVLLAGIVGLIGGLHWAAYHLMLINPGDPILVGRYLLPLIALFGVAVAMVCTALPRRIGPYVGVAVVVLGLALELSGLGMTALRFYA
ncbi:MAG TPA: DUF2142 domain-containing protein [Thermoleophilaceae bacterium]